MRSIAFLLALPAIAVAHPPEMHDAPVTLEHHVMPKTIEAGGLEYDVVADWCKLPDETAMGNTHGGIVIDPDGNVHYNTDTERSIMVHTPDGEFVRTYAKAFPAIHGMVLRVEDGEPYIYAAHLGGKQAIKLKLDGTVVWTLGVPKESGKYDDEGSYRPTAIAVGPDGDIYVADGYGLNWIHQWTKDLEYIRSFGGRGTEDGQFRACHGMALDTRGDEPCLLICDRENRRLQRFTLEGEFIDVAATGLRRPCSISFWNDHVAIAELEARVTILDGDFEVVAHLGDNPNKGHWANNGVPPADWTPGIFTAPHGVCFDDDGNLYVMDWNATGRMSKLERVPEKSSE